MTGRKQRSALGIGVTTLITILVVMLLATFSVLSLVSARSDLHLSQMAVQSTQDYYAAESEATQWYAQLDSFLATKPSGDLRAALKQAGYVLLDSPTDDLVVSKVFPAGEKRKLTVSIAIAADGSTTIRQWQTAPIATS
jgi:hypothetical protein